MPAPDSSGTVPKPRLLAHPVCTEHKRHGSKTAPACSSLSAPKRQQDAKMVTTHLKKCKLEFNHPKPFPNQHFENTMLILHWFGNTSKPHPLRGRRDNAVTTWGCAQNHCICNATTTPSKLVSTSVVSKPLKKQKFANTHCKIALLLQPQRFTTCPWPQAHGGVDLTLRVNTELF